MSWAGQERQFALNRCILERGGATGKMIFIKVDALTMCVEHPAFERDLKQAVMASGDTDLMQWIDADKAKRGRRRFGCLLLIALFIGALVMLPTIWRYTAGTAVESLPPSVDQKIGEVAWGQLSAQIDLIEVTEVDDAMQVMYEALWPHFGEQPWTIEIFLANESQINAFAVPGGVIVFHSGLLYAAQTPEEVAGVLAHEIAHVTHRHSVHGIAESLGIVVAAQVLLGDVSGLVVLARELITMAALNSRSQADEAEADATAARALYDANIDPRVLATFFERLREKYGDNEAADYWMSTHPSHGARIAAVNTLADQLEAEFGKKSYEPLGIDWPALQAAMEAANARGYNSASPSLTSDAQDKESENNDQKDIDGTTESQHQTANPVKDQEPTKESEPIKD